MVTESLAVRKYVCCRSNSEADVYHHGVHECVAMTKKNQRPTDIVENALLVDTTATPAQIQRNCVMSALNSQQSWEVIDSLIEQTSSNRKISNEKTKQMKTIQPQKGFPGLLELKKFSDEKDQLLLFCVDRTIKWYSRPPSYR